MSVQPIYELKAITKEKIPVRVETSGDPTGALPEFAVTLDGSSPADVDFADGEWVGTWDAVELEIDALSPLAGAGQTLDVEAGGIYHLFVRWTIGVEVPVEQCMGTVVVT